MILVKVRFAETIDRIRKVPVFLAAMILVSALPACAQTIPKERWQKYSSAGGFTVLMPGEPHESIHDASSSPLCADATRLYAADVGLDQGYFSVVSCVYPQPMGDANASSVTFDRLQAIAARGTRGKIVAQKDCIVGGMPARRISVAFQINGTPQNIDEMFVLAGTHLFHLIAMNGQSQLTSEDLNRFFDSFSILPESAQIPEKPLEPATQVTRGVTYFECPTYPLEAMAMRLQGQVFMRVTTDGKKVIDLKTSGHPRLAQAAEENIRTWKFAEDAPKEFSITYSYVNEGKYGADPVTKCDAKMELLSKVQVSF
ncbi:MAG: energy transducer TonB [Candidatus Sulfotelmatobacter sp.]